jgi:hypothetical protein
MNRYSNCTFYLTLKLLILASGSSIDIKTLPPDPETKDLLAAAASLEPTRRSVIVADWAGDHSAVLDGDQGRVILSWSVQEEYMNFQVFLRN